MNGEILGNVELTNASVSLNEISSGHAARISSSAQQQIPVIVTATFTADLLQEPLSFWMSTLEVPAEVVVTPYGQLFQELLDPARQTSRNQAGFNVLVIRPEDWIRDRLAAGIESNLNHLRSVAADLMAALRSVRTRTSVPMLVYLCPTSSSLPARYAGVLSEIHAELIAGCRSLPGLNSWTHADLMRSYPLESHEDAAADRIAHIPFTQEYFLALATLLARRIAALVKPRCKVLAIDCDHTLWKGICGEDGVTGIELTPAHIKFQELLVRQHDAGVLLCLCSKNNPGDVQAVFRAHPAMPLREEHFISSRINWEAKSTNLRALAQELSLGLDSFVFIDDSSVECAEVRTHCPEVLCLQFPDSSPQIEHFIEHVWAFDTPEVTAEARQRTQQYRQNRARVQALQQAGGLDHFLASLDLKIDVAPLREEHLTRVAELVQRTNQFNMTSIRRSESEIRNSIGAGELQGLVVHVRDRFGDYGLVGVVFARRQIFAIEIDTFLLSCRVLGRGVEKRVLGEVARLARVAGLNSIVLRYRETPRNAPARRFLDESVAHFATPSRQGGECVYVVPVDYADRSDGVATIGHAEQAQEASSKRAASVSPNSNAWHERAYRLSRIADLRQAINRANVRLPAAAREFIAPRTAEEAEISSLWASMLRVDRVGVRDSFFDLGGDSLLAVQIVARVESLTGRELTLHAFFESPTVEGMARQAASALTATSAIQATASDQVGPLSFAQQRMWFIDRLEGGSSAYHIPVSLRLQGRVQVPIVQSTLDSLIERHSVLRTVFLDDGGQPMQKVVGAASFVLQTADLRSQSPVQRETELLDLVRQDLEQPFDLGSGRLIRGRLLQVADDEHVLLIVMHHIISDGWSVNIFIREFAALYQAGVSGQSAALQPLPVHYRDYAQWQRGWLTGPRLREQLSYWKQHLSGAPALLELPNDHVRPPVQSYRGDTVPLSLDAELVAELRRFAQESNLTLAMVLFAAWTIVLSRLSGQADLVVGMPVANRRRTDLEQTIGFFVNTLAVRTRFDDDPPIGELLLRIRQTMLAAYGHQDTPFEHVVEALQPTRSLSHSPIFQVMFVLQPTSRYVMQLPGLKLIEEQLPSHTAQFDITLSLQESAAAVCGVLNYASDLFERTTVQRWRGYFHRVLRAILDDSRVRVSRIALLDEEELDQVVNTFNATQAPYPKNKLVHQLFEEQVERTPHEVAVKSGGGHLTYQQLNCRSNQLARYLRARGAGPGCFVGLFVERSEQMVVALLGILKSGSAYVPLDPDYPAGRLEFMLNDTRPVAVLTQERLKGLLPSGYPAIALDTQGDQIRLEPATNLTAELCDARSSDLAYVIYTSGSTGQPKGVLIEHRSAVNLICWALAARPSEDFETVLQSTSLNFDLSVYECFVPLCGGGGLHVVRNALSLLTERPQLTMINTVPSAIAGLLDAGSIPQTTRVINLAGEALKRDLVERIFARSGVREVCNLYGPSETTTYSTWIAMPREEGFKASIGRPIFNTKVYILDPHRQPVPIGVSGEIYIAGAGVARGYLSQATLTAERFLQSPFDSEPQARMYKTGDLGRWRPDGTIEYLGRNDQQVKVRGFRIELGEIESQLTRHAEVQEAAVIAREDAGGKQLVAYVVAADPADAPSSETLRAYLKAALPEHMVPAAFCMLPCMPLTPNGKIDRRALPAPDPSLLATRVFAPPQGEIEEILAGVWQEVLKVERIGRHDNFFELGGHSLLIVQVLERLRRVGLWIELRRVFETPTLAELASGLTREAGEQLAVPPNLIPQDCGLITPDMVPLMRLEPSHLETIVRAIPGGAANIQDLYPLAPLQEGLLFHHLLSESSTGADAYVVPTVLAVSSRQRLQELVAALQAIVDRHDALRTAILWEHLPHAVQVVCRKAPIPLHEVALEAGQEVDEQLRAWLSPERQRMDLRHAPLLRLEVARDKESERWYVLLQLHHIVADNASAAVIQEEVAAHLSGAAERLPPAVPYRNHVAQALAHASTHDAAAFFRGMLADVTEPTAPFAALDVHRHAYRTMEASEQLDPALAQRVRTEARRLAISTATLFHAAWSLVVALTSGRDDVVFGTVLLGRLHGNAGAQQMLGMFINTLPLRLRLANVSATTLIETTQRMLVDLLLHEQSSLAAAQRCSEVPAPLPLFTSLLNYRHRVRDSQVEWSQAPGIELVAKQDRTNYPIVASVDDLGEGFRIGAQTDSSVDPQRLIAYQRSALRVLLDALLHSSQTPVLAMTILPDFERRQVLELFNATTAQYPRDRLIHELFEEQVARTPEATAAMCGKESITYSELNCRANQLARHLRCLGVDADQLVGLCVERSLEMIVALIAIWKAGGAYVPLDPGYPSQRLAHMLTDAKPRVVLTQKRLLRRLPQVEAKVMALDGDWNEVSHYATDNSVSPAPAMRRDLLAYVIYTSGSTGTPKGVMIEHAQVINLWAGLEALYSRRGGCRRVALNASFNFDASVQQFVQLLSGRTVILVPEEVRRDVPLLISFLRQHRIEGIDCTPSQIRAWIASGLLRNPGNTLRTVLVGGEAIDPELWRTLSRCAQTEFYNVYGPTECTVDSTVARISEDQPSPGIGKAMPNRSVYILNAARQPVPIGVVGELYIAGAGLARGYLNHQQLTEERFVADPFSQRSGGRMYRTGDLGRWRTDGTIEFLGRNDHQVKLRGYRIELGEIEAQLLRHALVASAAVVVREDAAGYQQLVAYIVANRTSPDAAVPTAEQWREHLRAVLPDYMVPSAYVLMERLPMTPSGKLDQRALPAPESAAYASVEHVAPQGRWEEELARVWERLLHVERVGREASFFDLGGHSLLVLKLLGEIGQRFGCSLRVTDVYKAPLLHELAARIQGRAAQDEAVDLSQEAILDPAIVATHRASNVAARSILLTGATGFVGRFLLTELLERTDATVYCVIRAANDADASARLRHSLLRWDLWRDECESRIVAVAGDMSQPGLGLRDHWVRKLTVEVDTIYHCATRMNHLETYAMARRANVEGAKEVLKLAAAGRAKVVNYVSTLSVFGTSEEGAARIVNERTSIDQERHLSSQGYTASKWVSEKLFAVANSRAIACNIFRVGLVWADSTRGRFDELQSVYRMLKTSLLAGCGIRGYSYRMVPTPVDYVSRAIVSLASRFPAGNGCFHISASDQTVGDVFGQVSTIIGQPLELLSTYEWIGRIRQLHEAGHSLPAVPLIEYAFSMDERAFYASQHREQAACRRIDCSYTHSELERDGIATPVFDAALLATAVEDMLTRDPQLRELFDSRESDHIDPSLLERRQRLRVQRL